MEGIRQVCSVDFVGARESPKARESVQVQTACKAAIRD